MKKILSIMIILSISVLVFVGCTLDINKHVAPGISGDNSIVIESENKDIIKINYDMDYFYRHTEEFVGLNKSADVLSEYEFLSEVIDKNNMKVDYQSKLYLSEDNSSNMDDYTKFQENNILCYLNDDEEAIITLTFSNNKIIGTWEAEPKQSFKESTIEKETVYIFERIGIGSSVMRAQFTVEEMNFIISASNVSRENFIEIIRTTIKAYKEV